MECRGAVARVSVAETGACGHTTQLGIVHGLFGACAGHGLNEREMKDLFDENERNEEIREKWVFLRERERERESHPRVISRKE